MAVTEKKRVDIREEPLSYLDRGVPPRCALDRPPGPGSGVTFGTNELPLFEDFRILRYEDVRARADWGCTTPDWSG